MRKTKKLIIKFQIKYKKKNVKKKYIKRNKNKKKKINKWNLIVGFRKGKRMVKIYQKFNNNQKYWLLKMIQMKSILKIQIQLFKLK